MHSRLPVKELFVVGIGASAGGLEAMGKLLSDLVPNGCNTYIVAQHMAKDGHIELVLRLLNRQQKLPVIEAKANVLIEADHVYLIPPGCIGVLQKGRIQLLPVTAEYISSPSVNALFNSIAQESAKKAIGIVLSGTGMDGVTGCRAIRAHGGMVMVQEPKSAQFSGMPMAVIEAKITDCVLTPEEMARQLNRMFPPIQIQVQAATGRPLIAPSPAPTTSAPLGTLIKQVFETTGVDFSSYKEETLQRRIDRRLSTLQLASFADYQAYIKQNPHELQVLQHLFLVSLSSFFRDSAAFATVKKHLAELLSRKAPGEAIRIWIPGCASGEECYTFAILLAELLGEGYGNHPVEITGSDLNPEALAIANEGRYRLTAFKEVDHVLLERYFDHKGQHYQVKPALRDVCRFIKQDIVGSKAPDHLDMVSCRNLLIYMKSNLQDLLFKKFHGALLPRGLLFIGQSENIGLMGSNLFTAIDHFHRLYLRRESDTR